jgi:hypothetical protein
MSSIAGCNAAGRKMDRDSVGGGGRKPLKRPLKGKTRSISSGRASHETTPQPRTEGGQLGEDVLLRQLLRLMRGEWLGEVSPEAKRFLPSLLLGLYEADRQGRRLSKREASALMGADPASSGPKYIGMAERLGLIEIDKRPSEDRRKDFLRPTARLHTDLDRELAGIWGTVEAGKVSYSTPSEDRATTAVKSTRRSRLSRSR